MTYTNNSHTTPPSTSSWTDFGDAEPQQCFDLIPKGTIAKVRMTLKPGGFNNPDQNWTGGYATRNAISETVYLACEFVILEGPYAKRKVWGKIGLHSPKSPEWAKIGRSFVKSIPHSARGISEKDQSPQAAAGRRITALGELDGIEFTARIDVEKDWRNEEELSQGHNVIKMAITPDHKEYGNSIMESSIMGSPITGPVSFPSSTTVPSWAQPSERTQPSIMELNKKETAECS